MNRVTRAMGRVLWTWMTRNVDVSEIGDPFAVSLD